MWDGLETGRGAGKSVRRLAHAVQQLDLSAERLACPLEEFSAVCSIAGSAGRHGPHSGWVAMLNDLAVLPQRVNHTADRVVAKPTGRIDSPPESGDPLEPLPQSVPVVDEQARGVRAAVHDGDRAGPNPAGCSLSGHQTGPSALNRSSTQSPTGSSPPASR